MAVMHEVIVKCPYCSTWLKVIVPKLGGTSFCTKCTKELPLKNALGSASGASPPLAIPIPPVSPGRSPSTPSDNNERPCGEDGIPLNWEPGDVILDLYEVIELPGTKHGYAEGGMGRVNLVQHREWQRNLAMKSVLPAKSASARDIENFKTEAEQWVDKIGLHPNIVACHYVRVLGGVPRVFIEYVDGGSLQEWIDSKRLYEGGPKESLARILDVAIQMAWGLHYVHELRLIHQDMKPLNVMMTSDGVAKVTDFGLAGAKALASGEATVGSAGQTLLATGAGMMTPAYCSPEQVDIVAMKKGGIASDRWPKLTRRTDIWSWAVSVLHMFLGKIAWPGGQVAHVGLGRQPEEEHLPTMPIAVKELLRTCFQKQPDDRPHDLMQVAGTLQTIYRDVIGQLYPREAPRPEEALADSLNNRAVSLIDLGKQEAAEKKWQEALNIDPHHPEATFNSGLIQWRSAQMTDEQLLQRLLEARTTCAEPVRTDYLVGLVHLERNDYKAAIQVLEGTTSAGNDDVASALAIAQSRVSLSGTVLRTFDEHPGFVMSLVWSPDCRFTLSGMENSLWLWDVSSGHCLRSLDGHTDLVTSVAWNPDGTHGLSGSRDTTMRLWEIVSGRCLHSFEGHTDYVTSVAWSSDGCFALSASRDCTVRVWKISDGSCLLVFKGHSDQVNSVAWSPDNRFALSASGDSYCVSDGTILLWELSNGRCLRSFEGHECRVASVAWSPDGDLALSGSLDQTLRLWEVSSGRCLRLFKGHTQQVDAVAWSPDGRFAVSASSDETLRLWEVSSGRCLRTFGGDLQCLTSIAWSPDGRFVLSGGDGPLRVWRVAPTSHSVSMVISQPFTPNRKVYHGLLNQARQALSDSRTADAVGFLEHAREQPGCARRPDALDVAKQLTRFVPHRAFSGGWAKRVVSDYRSAVTSVAWSPDGQFALAANLDHLVLSEVSSGRSLRTFKGHTQHVFSVAWSPNGRFALSASWDTTLKLWEISSGRCLSTLTGHEHFSTSVAWSPDGRFALSGSYDKTLKMWEIGTGRCIRSFTGHLEAVTSVAFSPDGRFAISGEGDGGMREAYSSRLWEVSSGRCLRTFEGHQHYINGVAWSPDGTLAVSGSSDNTLLIWKFHEPSPCISFEGHNGPVTSVAFSPDGRFLLSGSWDKTLKIWEVASGRCLRTFEGHTLKVTSVAWSPDGHFAISGGSDKTLRIWELDWEFERNQPADWHEGAQHFLTTFLTLQMPYDNRLERTGDPTWDEAAFGRLLDKLACAGYGWLRPEGVRRELDKMAATWQGPLPLVS